MGFLDKIFSFSAKNTYREICRAMIRAYNKMKQQNPKVPSRELYALALSLRPTWKRKNPYSFTFFKGKTKLTIKKEDKFEDMVRNIIILETIPKKASHNQSSMTAFLEEISGVIREEFKEFKE